MCRDKPPMFISTKVKKDGTFVRHPIKNYRERGTSRLVSCCGFFRLILVSFLSHIVSSVLEMYHVWSLKISGVSLKAVKITVDNDSASTPRHTSCMCETTISKRDTR